MLAVKPLPHCISPAMKALGLPDSPAACGHTVTYRFMTTVSFVSGSASRAECGGPAMHLDANPLDRPPWSALTSSHAAFAVGNDLARRYRPEYSPLSALREVSAPCLAALSALMQPGEAVGLFGAEATAGCGDLVEVVHRPLEQFVYDKHEISAGDLEFLVLTEADAPEMMALAKLTEPGPVEARTVLLGEYLGIRSGGRLIAVARAR